MCVSNARFSECEPAQTVWVCGRGRRAGDFSEATFRAVRTAQERGHGFRNRRGLFFILNTFSFGRNSEARVARQVLPAEAAAVARWVAIRQVRAAQARRAPVPWPATWDPFPKDEVAELPAQIHQAPTFEETLQLVAAAPWPAVAALLPAPAEVLAVPAASKAQALLLAGSNWVARPVQAALGSADWAAAPPDPGRAPQVLPEPPPKGTDPLARRSRAQPGRLGPLGLELLEPCLPVLVPPLEPFLERAPLPLVAVHLSCACRTQGAFGNASF